MTAPAAQRVPLLNRLALRARAARDVLLDAVLPQTCAACAVPIAAGHGLLCGPCDADIRLAANLSRCGRCGRTVHAAAIRVRECGLCHRETFWNVGGLARIGPYSCDALRSLILSLKYRGAERAAEPIADLLADALRREPWIGEIEMLVPVPMHWLRRWQRPCDHAYVLAAAVGRRLGIPVRSAAVRRPRYGPSQTRAASRYSRFENIRGCFAPARRARVQSRVVCIIDNLLVSGATIHEVSKVLRRAGAARIYAAVAARSVLPGETEARIGFASAPPAYASADAEAAAPMPADEARSFARDPSGASVNRG